MAERRDRGTKTITRTQKTTKRLTPSGGLAGPFVELHGSHQKLFTRPVTGGDSPESQGEMHVSAPNRQSLEGERKANKSESRPKAAPIEQ